MTKCYDCGKLIPRDTEPIQIKDMIAVRLCNYCKEKRIIQARQHGKTIAYTKIMTGEDIDV